MMKLPSVACAILLGSAALIASSSAYAESLSGKEIFAAPVLPDPPEVLTADEAALLLRLDESALLNFAQTGQVPGRRVGNQWRFSRAALLGWLAGYQQGMASAESKLANPASYPDFLAVLKPLDTHAAASIAGRGLNGAGQASQLADPAASDAPIGAAPKGRTASEVFLRDQRILLAPNELTVDFGLFYARNDDLILGVTGSDPTLGLVESESVGGVLIGRYAVGRDTEVFASTSYQKQRVAVIANGQSFTSSSRDDFGDIGLGVRHTVIHEGPGRPDVIVMLEGSIPTGASSYSLGGGVTLVKSFDPSVLFGSIEYRHTFSRNFEDITRLQPRNRIEAQIGYAFALNDTVILNTALSGIFNLETTFDNAVFRQNETFNLRTGLTARISRNLFIQPSVSYRLNGPGSGLIFGLNFPYTFGL